MTHAFSKTGFPELEGDCVTFIGCSFINYTESQPYYRVIIVKGSCLKPDKNLNRVKENNVTVIEKKTELFGANLYICIYSCLFHFRDDCARVKIMKLIFFTSVQRKEKIKAFYQPHSIIPNNVMSLHFFGSSYVFKMKSICISRKLLLMQDIKKLTS